MKIKSKLISLVCLITILPAIILGIMAYSLSKKALNNKISAEFNARKELIILKLNNILVDLNKSALAWTASPAMADVKIADSDLKIATFLFNIKKSYPILKDISVVDAKKNVIATTNEQFDSSSKKHINVTSIYDLDKTLKGKPQSKIGITTNDNYLILPIFDVISKDGTVVGLIICEIDNRKIADIIQLSNQGKSDSERVNVYLISEKNTLASLVEPSVPLSYERIVKTNNSLPQEIVLNQIDIDHKTYVISQSSIGSPLPEISGNPLLCILQP